jgi:hypothetical protein
MPTDFSAAIRTLRNTPSFTFAALAVMAVGVGAAAAVFSVADGVALRGLPFDAGDRIVAVLEHDTRAADTLGGGLTSAPTFLDWRASQTPFEHLAAVGSASFRTRTSMGERMSHLLRIGLLIGASLLVATQPGPRVLGQKPPGDMPEAFAHGTISRDSVLETYPALSPDQGTLFFSVVNAAWTEGKILVTRLRHDTWTTPEVAPFSGGGSISWESSVSPDGKRMFFASNRPPSSGMDIWMVERTSDGSWSAPVRLPEPVNSPAEDGSPCVTSNGTLYFKSLRGGGGGSWLYRAALKDGRYPEVEGLGTVLKTTSGESEPYVSPDERYLLFISQTRKGGHGGWDLWVSFREPDGSWAESLNLGPGINTEDDEYGPRVSPDGKYLFFTRERRGRTMDIYWVSADVLDRLRRAPREAPSR